MAVLKDKKREYYAMKQNLRDEANAPEHLDSAGDALIRELARKQTDTVTSLEKQLKIRQEFEKGLELKPWAQAGLTTLEKFQNSATSGEESSTSKAPEDEPRTRLALSRHELELGLVEKPGSLSSVLFRFALSNRKGKMVEEDLVSKLKSHPLNRLKEIEEELYGDKGGKEKGEPERKKRRKTRRRRRKRKRVGLQMECKAAEGEQTDGVKGAEEDKEEEIQEEEEERNVTSCRPSLWDVKDMRKFCKNEQQGCELQKFYTIRDGKIVRVNVEPPERC